MREYRALMGPVAVIVLFVIAALWSPFEPHRPPVEGSDPLGSGTMAPGGAAVGPDGAPVPGAATAPTHPSWSDADWGIFLEKMEWAAEHRLDTLPLGSAVVALGRTFVGTAYVPKTLEAEGPERLVIDFRGLDCVTFVENVLALTTLARSTDDLANEPLLKDRARAEAAYEAILRGYRYRDGRIDGYASRLHYFTDWIADNARRGSVTDVTTLLSGVVDREPIDFMSTHPDAYRQLADPANVEAIRRAEARLSELGRHFVPQERISVVDQGIRDGDIIAATSTVEGLDVAHTGIALRVDGAVHLMHAPLVGDSVQISPVSLAERVRRIGGQDGIIVARPRER